MVSREFVLKAADDLYMGLRNWRMWGLLGLGDIRQRYARSMFGQFWITLSMAVFVGAIGSVYALLFSQPVSEYLPYLAVNFIVWTLIAGIITEASMVFTQAESFLRQENIPKTVFVMRVLIRNLVAFMHNIVIIPLVFLILLRAPSWTWFLAPVGLVLILVAGFFTALLLGVLCTRFRDLPQIVQNIVQVAFFVTPVTWPSESLRNKAFSVVEFNPFAAFLHVVAEPLQGKVPSSFTYFYAITVICLLVGLAFPLFARFRARIVYWL